MAEPNFKTANVRRVDPQTLLDRVSRSNKEAEGGVKPETLEAFNARRNPFASGENYNPEDYNATLPEIGMDALRSVPTGLTHLAESLPGIPGDIGDARYDLARWINSKTFASPGFDNAMNTAQGYDPLAMLPNTDEVASGFTDPLLEATGTKDFLRYQPQTPWGKAVDTGAQQLDVPVGGAVKLAGKAGRFFR